MQKIFAISGLGADKRIFKYLNLNADISAIDWIKTKKNEKLQTYAKRLIDEYKIHSNSCILGVSFGGLIAIEMSKLLNPKLTILISSIEKKDLYKINFFIKKILKLTPLFFFKPPKLIANYFFGAKNKKLLFEILKDTNLDFAKWAINEFLNWKNMENINNCLKIHGNKDRIIALKKNKRKTFIINGGGHFMIVDKAKEISKIINDRLKNLS